MLNGPLCEQSRIILFKYAPLAPYSIRSFALPMRRVSDPITFTFAKYNIAGENQGCAGRGILLLYIFSSSQKYGSVRSLSSCERITLRNGHLPALLSGEL